MPTTSPPSVPMSLTVTSIGGCARIAAQWSMRPRFYLPDPNLQHHRGFSVGIGEHRAAFRHDCEVRPPVLPEHRSGNMLRSSAMTQARWPGHRLKHCLLSALPMKSAVPSRPLSMPIPWRAYVRNWPTLGFHALRYRNVGTKHLTGSRLHSPDQSKCASIPDCRIICYPTRIL